MPCIRKDSFCCSSSLSLERCLCNHAAEEEAVVPITHRQLLHSAHYAARDMIIRVDSVVQIVYAKAVSCMGVPMIRLVPGA